MEVNQTNEQKPRVSIFSRIEAGSERENLVESLSMLLSSGMDAISALTAIEKEVKSGGAKGIIMMVKSDIAGGSTLSVALERTNLFSPHIMALIKTGEESGRLSDNLKVVVSQINKERTFRAKVTSAMMYPVFVLFLTLTIGIGLAWFVLPRLAGTFSSLKIPLPWITRAIINLGNFLARYGQFAVPGLIAFMAILIYFVFINRRTNFLGQRLLFGLPGVKRLLTEVELSRFGYILGNLLSAGIPVTQALSSLSAVSDFAPYKKFYKHLVSSIEEGESFQKSFDSFPKVEGLIPVSIQQMIVAAENSGYLSDTLIKIGERYEEKTDITTKDLSVILEPILLVIVWLGVLVVALAVILPIYSLVGGLTSGQPQIPVAVTVTPTAVVPTETATPTLAPKRIKVQETEIGYLNIREDASVTSLILGRALPGDIYEYKAREGDWYQIIIPDERGLPAGRQGWVNASYVEEIQ